MIVVGESIFNPQYTIPLAGMIIGNAMTGVTLGLKSFNDNIKNQRSRIEALLNLGVTPKKILLPYVNNALETALLPTLNNMLGMGIISLPGMMTGQILSGTQPTTAIMYQIAIMIAICTSVCLTVFCSLNFGYRTLYNKRNQISL
jgi:putative ABC transport system permease protein